MSIKSLFTDFRDRSNIYVEYSNDKEYYKDVESYKNAAVLEIKKNTYVPQIDYSEPANFIRFSSAELFYDGALKRIVDYYPYDGSSAEKTQFYNQLLDGEKYIFNNLYPRFNGFASIGTPTWGPNNGGLDEGYGLPQNLEHITFKGGPGPGLSGSVLSSLTNNPYNNKFQSANIYQENPYTPEGLPPDYGSGTRTSNLKTSFSDGVTVEFWLKHDGFNLTNTAKQVVFDLWNSSSVPNLGDNTEYGRLRIELFGVGSASDSAFRITVKSGSAEHADGSGLHPLTASIGTNTTKTFIQNWHHYAFSFYNTGSNFVSKLYVDGKLNDTNTYPDTIGGVAGFNPGEITTSKMIGRIGALVTKVSGSGGAMRGSPDSAAGAGKLSGSVDEFRFWKAARNSKEIAQNYFNAIDGGTNTDISNTTLGVYYKFNEGIVGNAAIDSNVLDYSGRITNAVWTGYSNNSRNTGSAIVLGGASHKEYKDPVVYTAHPNYASLRQSLIEKGIKFDSNNNSAFVNYAPSWILDEHQDSSNNNLNFISHIVGSYMDKMYALARDIPSLKHVNYTSASYEPVPFAIHMPTSLGLYTPELFIDSSLIEGLLDKSSEFNFENKLSSTKNQIYMNLYNNLTNIYKSKGTEKAIRNVLRCFHLDDDLIKIKTYNQNATFEIKNNLKQAIVNKNSINFNTPQNINAVVYQRSNFANNESIGYVGRIAKAGPADSPTEVYVGQTFECDIVFPTYDQRNDSFNRNFTTTSLFGVVQVDATGSQAQISGSDPTFLSTISGSDLANFQVYAVRDKIGSKNVHFMLTSSYAPHSIPTLTSSNFLNVYDNTKWNFSVRIEPNWVDLNYDETQKANSTETYKVIFRGINDVIGTAANSFEVSSTVTRVKGQEFIKSLKRLYVGAHRMNMTGAVIHESDVKVLNARIWAKSIDNHSLNMHNYGKENSGITNLYKNISPFDQQLVPSSGYPVAYQTEIPNYLALSLDWTFANVSTSNVHGVFRIMDASSGSQLIRNNYGWIGGVSGYQHTGYGYGFATSSSGVVDNQAINSFNFVDPEQVISSDMIQILNEDELTLPQVYNTPSYYNTVEKNMYDAISSEMLTFFAGAIDFNNIIGEPVNRYRHKYKSMEKLREVFFRKVDSIADVEKFVGYYKWFDEALSIIIRQLLPASMAHSSDTLNVIESHVLERNKYQTQFPTLESRYKDPDGVIFGRSESSYPYATGFSPMPRSPRDTTIRAEYWKTRAERTAIEISSGDATIDAHREIYRRVINTNPFLSGTLPTLFGDSVYTIDTFSRRNFIKNYVYKPTKQKIIKAGSNFPEGKNIQFALTSVKPSGPVNTSGGRYIPLNVLLSFMSDLAPLPTNNDPKPNYIKTRRKLKVLSGRDFEGGFGYYNMHSDAAFPFSIFETTVTSGQQATVVDKLEGANLQITNLHNDVYGPDAEKPMQTSFAEHHVGGHQSRHVKINSGTDNSVNRPEAWKILLGTCTGVPSGAIGLVGPDYPPPNTTLVGKSAYPYQAYQKAVYYRDMTAKRPFNIKNIAIVTGSNGLGNYTNTYEYIQTVGADSNPRHFINQQPDLPQSAIKNKKNEATSIRTFLNTHRTTGERVENIEEYSTAYLNSTANKSVFISRFSNPGGIEVMSRGYQDFKSSEFSVYNNLNYRNLSVRKPWQGPSGTLSQPIINGDTTNIQAYDIHGFDYGLNSHLARHTARFGRDSLHVPDDQTGATYDELPGFHKIHRNNISRRKIIYGMENVDIEGYDTLTNTKSLHFQKSNLSTAQDNVFHLGSLGEDVSGVAAGNARSQRIFDARWADNFGGPDKSVDYSFSAWLKFPDTTDNPPGRPAVYQGIFDFGYNQALSRPLMRLSIHPNNRNAMFYLATTDNSSNGTKQYLQGNNTLPVIADNNWHHFVFTFSGSHGSLNSTGPLIHLYVDGTQTVISNRVNANFPFFQTSSQFEEFRDYPGTSATSIDPITFFGHVNQGGSGANQPYEFSGFADNAALYRKTLSSTEVSALYNSGKPCDLTSSRAQSLGIGTGSLYAWFRMGDNPLAGADNTSASGSAIANLNDYANTYTNRRISNIYPRVSGLEDLTYGYLLCDAGKPLSAGTSSINFLTGCQPPQRSNEIISGFAIDNLYDNYYVQHQIPRSTKQYAWINKSLVSDNGYVGFVPESYTVKKSDLGLVGDELTEPYSLLSSSEVGAAYFIPVALWFPTTASEGQRFLRASKLNTVIHESFTEAVGEHPNTVGYTDNRPLIRKVESGYLAGNYLSGYLNGKLIKVITTRVEAEADGAAFNALMYKRGNEYGFPSWKQLRQADNPIIRNEKRMNVISVVDKDGDDNNLVAFDMPVLCARALPTIVNFDAKTANLTLKATGENETIYYTVPEMNDMYQPRARSYSRPDMQLIHIARSEGNSLNWVISQQQIYPSLQNEFKAEAISKPTYDNKYWRDSRKLRNQIDATLNVNGADRIQGAPLGGYVSVNSQGFYVSQSAWPLDAPEDFKTRNTLPQVLNLSAAFREATSSGENCSALRFSTGSPGELQNEYTYYYDISEASDNIPSAAARITWSGVIKSIGAVYARPHVLGANMSARTSYAPRTHYAGSDSHYLSTAHRLTQLSNGSGTPLNDSSWIDPGAGAAFWDAPQNAGYYVRDPRTDTLTFVSAPSKPWFNSYDDYKTDLKLLTRGFAILPEYRISENLGNYLKDGDPDSSYQSLEFEIPHVPDANSKVDGDFFLTYSNSEFLKDFLQIKAASLLNATEIRLSVTGAIRFNPYKGFYPVQRTMDMVSQFRNTYQQSFMVEAAQGPIPPGTGSGGSPYVRGGQGFNPATGSELSNRYRLITDKLYSPGILYNTIKSGMAVDYPIVSDPMKIDRGNYHSKASTTLPAASSSFMATTLRQDVASASLLNTGSFFDERIPFEAIIEPNKYLGGRTFVDMEANYNSRLIENISASFTLQDVDFVYDLMSRNFFGAVPSFFLKNEEFTSIKSSVKTDTYTFSGSEVYMMRVKMNRSTAGTRTYAYEVDGMRKSVANGDNERVVRYAANGAKAFVYIDPTDLGHTESGSYSMDKWFQIPQDPMYASVSSSASTPFRETFTMYSRASAFGPDLVGRPATVPQNYTGSLDCFNGYNPAYTPPYTNGEAWADIIFRPKVGRTYKIEDIVADCTAIYWRFDAGRPLSDPRLPPKALGSSRALIWERYTDKQTGRFPYSGQMINDSSMQLSASVNLFGVEKISFTEEDKFGNLQTQRPAESVGQRWVIRPKFETPMLNFANITGSQITFPEKFGGPSVAYGMWHQFGRMPKDNEGIYLSVEDIPKTWLQYHYNVVEFNTPYNTEVHDTSDGAPLDPGFTTLEKASFFTKVKSLADLVGFSKNQKAKLGELKPKTTLREAVVAVPYIIDNNEAESSRKKKFISIPPERYAAAKKEAIGSAIGDTATAAGVSISKQLQKMDRYILPPQFDFINNPDTSIDPFVMYIFEFEYKLDRDDLSYIWQNLAPRDYQKITFQHQSVAHQLVDAEILSERVLAENQQLRWMIFKVKQKGQEDYFDYVDEQAKLSTTSPAALDDIDSRGKKLAKYAMRYNWPYDYVSFVEMAKVNVEIKYSGDPNTQAGMTKSSTMVTTSKRTMDASPLTSAQAEASTAPTYTGLRSTTLDSTPVMLAKMNRGSTGNTGGGGTGGGTPGSSGAY